MLFDIYLTAKKGNRRNQRSNQLDKVIFIFTEFIIVIR